MLNHYRFKYGVYNVSGIYIYGIYIYIWYYILLELFVCCIQEVYNFFTSAIFRHWKSDEPIKITIFLLPILFVLHLSIFKQDEFSIEYLIHS